MEAIRVVFQIGYTKAYGRRREGQIVTAHINDMECQMAEEDGKYLTSIVDRKTRGFCWFLYEAFLELDDIVKISVKTSVAGAGVDEGRTFESLYYVEEEAPVREVMIPGVGLRGYPLIKGRVLEMGSVSEKDKRKISIDSFLKEKF
jgi:hypothetical protein